MGKYKKVLLTGGSGNLGKSVLKSNLFPGIFASSREEMDIVEEKSVVSFFEKNDPDAVIHCAAMVNMVECEENPASAMKTNIIGTYNVAKEIFERERSLGKNIRFIYISTDGVYPSTKGGYSEIDETNPYNTYGWSKLGGECVAHMLKSFCIIRTSFFDPEKIKHEFYAIDKYSSRVPISYLPKAIAFVLESNFTGTINIGGKRESDYEKYKSVKPGIKPCTYDSIAKNSPVKISRDASMDSSLWRKLTSGVKSLKIND